MPAIAAPIWTRTLQQAAVAPFRLSKQPPILVLLVLSPIPLSNRKTCRVVRNMTYRPLHSRWKAPGSQRWTSLEFRLEGGAYVFSFNANHHCKTTTSAGIVTGKTYLPATFIIFNSTRALLLLSFVWDPVGSLAMHRKPFDPKSCLWIHRFALFPLRS